MPWDYQEKNRIKKNKNEKRKTILMYAIEQNKSLYFTISHIGNVIYLNLSENYSSFPQIMEEKQHNVPKRSINCKTISSSYI